MIYLKSYYNFFNIEESISVEKIDDPSYESETVLSLPYSNLIEENRESFFKKLVRISKDLGIKPIWLLHTIFNESKFDPRNYNKKTKGVGLLSFLPQVIDNFIDLETGKNYSPNQILQMDNLDQLDIIKSFYGSWFQKMNLEDPIICGDFSSVTFYPGLIKKDWNWEFPKYVIEKNQDLFKKIGEGKTKKDYYNYIENTLNYKKEYQIEDGYFLGDFTGGIYDPYTYNSKNTLEFYKNLIMNIEDPSLNPDINDISINQAEKNKQTDK